LTLLFFFQNSPIEAFPPPLEKRIVLTVSPASEPQPALRYPLLPTNLEQTPGNGAAFYYRGLVMFSMHADDRRRAELEKISDWLECPLRDIPVEEAKKLLRGFTNAFREIERGAFCETCDWGHRLRDLRGPETVAFILEDFSQARILARALACQARVQIAEGKTQEALRTLRIGLQFSRDLAREPLLITGLIASVSASTMLTVLEDFVQLPDAPNLYWSLANLPQPFIDIRPAMDFEMDMPYRLIPELKDAESSKRTPEEWNAWMHASFEELMPLLANDINVEIAATRFALSWKILEGFPRAKQALIASGLPAERVERMAVGQVLAIHTARTYAHTRDEMYKWLAVPYPQSAIRMDQAEKQLRKDGYLGPNATQEIIPLGSMLMPAMTRVLGRTMRIEQRVRALQALELLRWHATLHERKFPAKWDEVQLVPPPLDPFTGQPFPFQLEGAQLVLVALDEPLRPLGETLIFRLQWRE